MKDIDLQAIRDRAEAALPGPWRWRGLISQGSLRLSTPNSPTGEATVMDYRRAGMQYGQPRFQRPDGLMDLAKEIPIFEVCRDAVSADDPRVYRQDIVGFRNANAEFIAHARQDIDDLLAYITKLEAMLDRDDQITYIRQIEEHIAEIGAKAS